MKRAGAVNMLAYVVWSSAFAVPPLLLLALTAIFYNIGFFTILAAGPFALPLIHVEAPEFRGVRKLVKGLVDRSVSSLALALWALRRSPAVRRWRYCRTTGMDRSDTRDVPSPRKSMAAQYRARSGSATREPSAATCSSM